MYNHFWHPETVSEGRFSVYARILLSTFRISWTEPPFRANLVLGYVHSGPERTSFSGSNEQAKQLTTRIERKSETNMHTCNIERYYYRKREILITIFWFYW